MSIGIKPTNIRVLMTLLTIILVGVSSVGFYMFQDWLNTNYLKKNSSSQSVNNSSTGTNTTVVDQASVNKANSLLASSQSYEDQTKKDLDTYATNSNITISSTSFSEISQVTDIPGLSLSLQHSIVSISLSNPVKFNDLIKFLKSIETNLPKLQPSEIKISPVSGSDEMVNVESLKVEVYIR